MSSQDLTLCEAMSDEHQVKVGLKCVYEYVNKDLFFSIIFPYEEVEASLFAPDRALYKRFQEQVNFPHRHCYMTPTTYKEKNPTMPYIFGQKPRGKMKNGAFTRASMTEGTLCILLLKGDLR
eukprot:13119511-Ditylum_brightwellii.AAC.1